MTGRNAEKRTPAANATARRHLALDIVLWTVSFIIMLAAAMYQERTGPTWPSKGTALVAGAELHYKLLRTHGGLGGAMVSLPDPGAQISGRVMYRRYQMPDEFTAIPMAREQGKLFAELPHQPPAGKLEYYIALDTPQGEVKIPSDRSVVIRFKGDVPLWALLPHIILMFFGMLFSMRTAFELLHPGARLRRLAWWTLGLLMLGGMFFGPLVQKFAFGAYWTGVPFGWDLTDNKVLIAILVWAVVVYYLGWPKQPLKPLARWLCLLAALLTLVVYLVPHSMHGSQLDYSKVEQGVPADKAIKSG
jgi:hypothetical protein